MVSASLLTAIALAASPAHAFTSVASASTRINNNAAAGPLYVTDDASAAALSDYMAKSHEEKLKAVKTVEEAKNSEIEALKAEINQLKSSSSLAAPAAPLASASTPELESKLESYQNFMAEYIVNAQQQKFLAVKEAELKAEQKFQERLEKLFEGSGMPGAAAAAVVVEETAKVTSFQSRNAVIIAAGAAGKSRWGNAEIERAIKEQAASPTPAAAVVTTEAPSSAATSFESRNAQVVAAGAAGKSRWGNAEVERAANGVGAAPVAVAVEEKKEASLEDRINLGALMLSA